MACLYGAFIGFGAAMWLQADLNSLAARRSVTPTSKLTLILMEMSSSFSAAFCECVPPDFLYSICIEAGAERLVATDASRGVYGVCDRRLHGDFCRKYSEIRRKYKDSHSSWCFHELQLFAGLMNGR